PVLQWQSPDTALISRHSGASHVGSQCRFLCVSECLFQCRSISLYISSKQLVFVVMVFIHLVQLSAPQKIHPAVSGRTPERPVIKDRQEYQRCSGTGLSVPAVRLTDLTVCIFYECFHLRPGRLLYIPFLKKGKGPCGHILADFPAVGQSSHAVGKDGADSFAVYDLLPAQIRKTKGILLPSPVSDMLCIAYPELRRHTGILSGNAGFLQKFFCLSDCSLYGLLLFLLFLLFPEHLSSLPSEGVVAERAEHQLCLSHF